MTAREQPSWQDLLDLVGRLDGGAFDSASVRFGDVEVLLSRTGPLAAPAPAPAAASAPQPAAPTPVAAQPAAQQPATGTTIDAPMIGVFYRRPSPGADPFVVEGDRVEAATTIGILEIMKLMNPVTAGASGVLTGFLVADGEAVEFGQALAVLDPAV